MIALAITLIPALPGWLNQLCNWLTGATPRSPGSSLG
jgi:hypothetical protein